MLLQMYVKNFILMDQVDVEFDEHMSAFTGETGAGKSLLMDAIGILKGDRISASMVKTGCDKAIIEGVFTCRKGHKAYAMLEEAGYDMSEDMLIVTREFTKEGRSIARINHRAANVSLLRQIMSLLVDIHSQHDTQYLLNNKMHLSLLDDFCKQPKLLQEVKEAYQNYAKITRELQEALYQDYNEDDLEFLTFQLNEIDDAAIQEGELQDLEEELKRMLSFEKITASASAAATYLDHNGMENLYAAYKELNSIQEEPLFQEASEKILDAYYTIEDAIAQVKDHVEAMEYDEMRFHELQERISLLHKILRKYGPTYEDVGVKRAELERKIDSILHRQDFIIKQEKLCQEARNAYDTIAKKLHDIRVKQALQLEKLVVKQLVDLQLENARFKINIEEFEGNATGIDKVEFMVSMNAGERLKSLSATASGGELSRFMLGLKCVFTSIQGIETVIFDEIDTGVSGSVAFSIGRKMQELAENVQVFCVTHLAPVAASGDQHYVVEKTQDTNGTRTTIRRLHGEERIQELAAISSSSSSKTALEAARELFHKARRQ